MEILSSVPLFVNTPTPVNPEFMPTPTVVATETLPPEDVCAFSSKATILDSLAPYPTKTVPSMLTYGGPLGSSIITPTPLNPDHFKPTPTSLTTSPTLCLPTLSTPQNT